MSKNIQYVGRADKRIVTPGDLKSLGLEDSDFKKTTFEPGYEYEVDDSVAEVLLEHATFTSEFSEVGDENAKTVEVDNEGGVDSSRDSQTDSTTAGGTTGTTGTTSTSGTGKKGRGSSTRTR